METGRDGPTLQTRDLSKEYAIQHAQELIGLDTGGHSVTWGTAELLSERPCKWDLSVAAEDSGACIGYVVASRRESVAHLHWLVVAAGWRGKGVSDELVRGVVSRAANLGLHRLTSRAKADHEISRSAQIRWGFRLVREDGGYLDFEFP